MQPLLLLLSQHLATAETKNVKKIRKEVVKQLFFLFYKLLFYLVINCEHNNVVL